MEMTCIVCPMGCRLTAEKTENGIVVTGNTCKRGEVYAKQEMTNPVRTLTSLVSIQGAATPLCPVKTKEAIPKSKLGEALSQLKKVKIQAPVKIGDVIIEDIASTGVALVATANRERV